MAPNTKLDISFAPATQATLTLRDKIAALIMAAKLVAAFPAILLSVLLGGKPKSGKTWQYELRSRLVHFALKRVTPRQIHLITPPTTIRVAQFARRKGVDVVIDELEYGAKIHWYGETKGQNVIMHLHGGGYNLPMGDQHIGFMDRTKRFMKSKGLDVDIALVEYSLTPTARYPTQLIQSVEALRFLIEKGYDPAKIVISGDSAGGCLVFSIASHILHPHPAIKPLVLPESSPNLGGLLSLSPWVTFNKDYPSYKHPSGKDVVFEYMVDTWSRWYVDRPDEPRHPELPAEDAKYSWDEYNQPLQAASSWWNGYPVKKTCVLIGEDETLRDGILEFAPVLKEGVGKGFPAGSAPSVEFVMCEGEIHTECLYDVWVPIKQEVMGKMAETTWAFYQDVFESA
ncbi:Esterase [Dactylella cylindrospora]|nr:Esterase [Dactylella cylindrospora]